MNDFVENPEGERPLEEENLEVSRRIILKFTEIYIIDRMYIIAHTTGMSHLKILKLIAQK